MQISIILLWVVFSFVLGSLAAVLGKKYGAVYPISLVAALTVIANIFASKIVVFGPFEVPASVIVFSMTFFLTDILSEKWSKKEAQTAVWAGFLANFVFILSLYFVLNWEAASYSQQIAEAFKSIFALTPRIVLAGFIAYLISQNHDVWAFHFWKKITKGRYLWFRNNASTIVSQLIDSVVFITIAFYGVLPIVPLIIGQWVAKIIIALLDTPFIYLSIWIMEKFEKL